MGYKCNNDIGKGPSGELRRPVALEKELVRSIL